MNKLLKKIIFYLIILKNNVLMYYKINRIYRSIRRRGLNHNISSQIIKDHKKLWHRFSRFINKRWLLTYGQISGIKQKEFVPENVYYNYIENVLNNYALSEAYADKNFYEILYDPDLFPKTIFRILHNQFLDKNYLQIENLNVLIKTVQSFNEIVVKPSLDSGGGFNVILIDSPRNFFSRFKDLKEVLNFFEREYRGNMIFQERVRQVEFFRKFNFSSVNTIRVFTYRSVNDNKVNVLHALLRVGRPGMLVDNQASGGLSIGIRNDGILKHFAIDKYGNKYYVVGEVDLSKQIIIPYYHDIIEKGIEIASKNYYSRLLGLDFYVDNNMKIKLMEVNNRNHEINFYQMNNGPLFGEFTNEIIEYSLRNANSVCLDFMV